MSEIVGVCLSQFHDDENSFELLLAYADGREVGHLVSRPNARRIAQEFANEFPAALAVQTQQGVEVKKLEWEDIGSGFSRASAPLFGNIRVEKYGSRFTTCYSLPGYSNTFAEGDFATAGEAKAACEAEYQKLMASALVDVPAVESEPVAWQTMDSAPKDGTEIIAAERWERNGKVRVRVYKYEGHPNYWHCRDDGVCIRPEYQSRYVWTPVPSALSTRKGSAGDGAATGTKGISDE